MKDLKLILDNHMEWLIGNKGESGQCADLRGIYLGNAYIKGAILSGANCRAVNFKGASLELSNFNEADFLGANLSNTNLYNASFCYANFKCADLSGADFRYAKLNCANIQYCKYDLYSIIQIYFDDPQCVTEAMRHDAANHPEPELFDAWAAGGDCPYNKKGKRLICGFEAKKELWKPGKPELSLYELWLEIAKSLEIKT